MALHHRLALALPGTGANSPARRGLQLLLTSTKNTYQKNSYALNIFPSEYWENDRSTRTAQHLAEHHVVQAESNPSKTPQAPLPPAPSAMDVLDNIEVHQLTRVRQSLAEQAEQIAALKAELEQARQRERALEADLSLQRAEEASFRESAAAVEAQLRTEVSVLSSTLDQERHATQSLLQTLSSSEQHLALERQQQAADLEVWSKQHTAQYRIGVVCAVVLGVLCLFVGLA